MAISSAENRWQDSERWGRDGQRTMVTCQARWAVPVEKADETRVIFIVRGWWGDKQHTPSTGGRRDALHFRYDDNSKHPTTLQLFIVTYLSTTGHGSDRYGKHETERRGVSGSKRKPLNGISAEQKTEKAGGKSAAESRGNPGPSIFPPIPRRVQL